MPLTGESASTSASEIEKLLEAPMPWIGLYVATASLICALAITADTFQGFRSKKLWFPIKIFSINATTLTLLAVAMKLPLDLTTYMWNTTDRLARVSSLIFMSTVIGNFMTCLGSMDDKEILMNVTAVGILVITVVANVCIQIIQMRHFIKDRELFDEELLGAAFMLLLFVMLISSAIMVPTMKRYLESKYYEMLKRASDEDLVESMEEGNFTIDKLKSMIYKYWVMAETSNPQFVIARSVTCTTSGVLCWLIALILIQAEVRMVMKYNKLFRIASKYGLSVKWIVIAQTLGVVIGTIAPVFRFFTAIDFKCLEKEKKSFKDELKIESYWTQRLVEWKESSLPLQIRGRKWKKLLHDAKRLILNLFVGAQILIVLNSKILRLISVGLMSPIISCLRWFKKNVLHVVSQSESEMCKNLDLGSYILLLEGEVDLPQKALRNIEKEVDKVIQTGEKKKPKNLIHLLHKIGNFRGTTEIDTNQIPGSHFQEPPKCWSLTIVSLTSVAIALPHIPKHDVNKLLKGVDEGLFYVKLIEKILDKKGKLLNLRNAGDVIWVGVELYKKWQDDDLHETSLNGRTSKEILQELSDKSEKTVLEFKGNVKDFMFENPMNWPVKCTAAHSMYRVCQRILVAYESDEYQTDERLFSLLSIIIANVMAACLTNLVRVIAMKCHRKLNRKEESVRQAALLLGETEEIIGILQPYRTGSLNPEELENREKWCNLMKKKKQGNGVSYQNERMTESFM